MTDDITAIDMRDLALLSLLRDGRITRERFDQEMVWSTRPVDIRTFITGEDYLNLGEFVHPKLLDVAEMIEAGDTREGYLNFGKGSGKTAIAAWTITYGIYRWQCYRNPYQFHHVLPGEKVAVVNMSTGLRNAKALIWTSIQTIVKTSHCFEGRFRPFEDGSMEIMFDSGMMAMCGHSSSKAFEGFSFWRGVLDEANKLKDDNDRIVADELFGVLESQSKTRFPNDYKILATSSSVNDMDFLARKMKPIIRGGEALPGPFVPSRTPESVEKQLSYREEDFPQGQWKYAGGLAVIAPTWLISPKHTFETMKRDLETKPLALAAYGCKPPSAGEEAYFKEPSIAWTKASKELKHPFNQDGTFAQWFLPGAFNYYMHYDLAVSRDTCGIACAHYDGEKDRVIVDWMLGVKATAGGEVQIDAVRQLVYAMRDRGFNIAKVSYDGWQSIESLQVLSRHGFESALYSVDRSREAYDTLLEHMLTGKVEWYEYDEFTNNIKSLVVVGGKKVDHLKSGGKDVSDAVAAVVFHASQDRQTDPFVC